MTHRKRRGRLSAHQWMADWFLALRTAGWESLTRGLPTKRTILYPKDTTEHPIVDLRKDQTLLTLIPKETFLPLANQPEFRLRRHSCTRHWVLFRGRAADKRRQVEKIEDESATGLLRHSPTIQGTCFVEFEGALYEPCSHGQLWTLTQDKELLDLYAAYRQHSPHHQSFRSYQRKNPIDLPI